MYENNFSGVNNSETENREYGTENSAYDSVANAYSGMENTAYNNSASSYSTNTTGGLYSSAAVENTHNSNAAGSVYNSSAIEPHSSAGERSAYGNGSTEPLYTSAQGGSAYNANAAGTAYGTNTAGNSYNANMAGNAYGSYNASGSSQGGTAYGHGMGTWDNSNYRQSEGNYQYGSTYANAADSMKKEKKKKEKKKREKTGNGYFKKVLVCVSLGLFFGVCAGLGLYAVESVTGMLDNNAADFSASGYAAGENGEAGNGGSKEVVSDSVNYSADGSDIQKTQTVTTVVSDVSDVVAAVMPAVVSINNTYTERLSYFGQTMTSEAQASGSGIIVGKNDTELLVATNYHVIADADSLKVQFVENSEAQASVKGMDADMDLAVIAVSLDSIQDSTLSKIAIATLGDSDALTVGEPAIAIGNSLGYGQSVTTGVISALNRDMELSDGSNGTFIQTDAAINPGNSGGALLNIRGEVIGINSNKIGGSVIEGMGYAIPISAASPIIAELMLKETKNKVAEDERGFLGISGISVTSEVSSAYGMPEGVYIAQVYEGTAADAAGLAKGDIITSFDGESVKSMDELQTLLEYYAKGDTVEMTVMTVGNGGYHSRTLNITLGNKAG